MDQKELVQKIITDVGGLENISSLTHCITRLRFTLKDNSKAKTAEIEKLDVLGTQQQGGQYQVIIGNAVGQVYNEVIKQFPELAHSDAGSVTDGSPQKGNWFERLLNTLSSILVPILPAIIGGGMLKALVFILTNYKLVNPVSNFITVANIAADCMFYFLPFLIAVSAAKKFKTNEFMALALAGAMLYPTLTDGATKLLKPMQFGFLQLPYINYKASVIPIILSVWILSYVYRFFSEKLPALITVVFAPLLTLIIMIPIVLIVIAPLGWYAGDYIAQAVHWLMTTSPWLAGLLLGAARPYLVFTGMHYALTPLVLQEISTYGYSYVIGVSFISVLAQATSFFATYFLVKDPKQKQIAISSTVSGFLGVTEPGLYGIIMKYRAPMIGVSIGGGIGSMIYLTLGGKASAFVLPSILTSPVFARGGLAPLLIGMIVTIGLTFVSTLFLGKSFFKIIENDEENNVVPTSKAANATLYSPVNGEVVPVEGLKDETFAKKLMGESVAILPSDGNVLSPVAGKITAVFPTHHAVGILSAEGAEVLIHIGLDTVNLKGQHFTGLVHVGDTVKVGTALVKVDIEAVKDVGYDPTILTIVTNTSDYTSVVIEYPTGKIFAGEKLMTAVK